MRCCQIALLMVAGLAGCRANSSHDGADDILRAAIVAHGGQDRLSSLGGLRFVTEGRYEGGHTARRETHFGSMRSWTMTVSLGRARLTFGRDEEGCWEERQHVVEPCECEQEAPRGLSAVLSPLTLMAMLSDEPKLAGSATVDGRQGQVVRAGRVSAVVDDETRRLVSLRYAGNETEWMETFSEFESRFGAVLPQRRVLTRGKRPDMNERVVEAGPAGFDRGRLGRPAPISEGMRVDETVPPRSTAWTVVRGAWPEISDAARSLTELARARGHECCQPAHLILSALGEEASSWRVSVVLDGLEPVPEKVDGPHHFENHPASHVVGVFWHGCGEEALASVPKVKALVRKLGYSRAANAPFEIVCYRGRGETPGPEDWALVRVAVTGSHP